MIEPHTHEGIQTPKIKGEDLLAYPRVSQVPTDPAPEGTIKIYISGSTTKLYIRCSNTWVSSTLT
jgi:hypothetical protein